MCVREIAKSDYSQIVVLLYVLFVLYCSMYCLCLNVYCHRVTTQLQLTNISYHIITDNNLLCFDFLTLYLCVIWKH